MKSLVLIAALMFASLSFASDTAGAKGHRPKTDEIKIIREWK